MGASASSCDFAVAATANQSPSCFRRRWGWDHALSSFNASERACAGPAHRRCHASRADVNGESAARARNSSRPARAWRRHFTDNPVVLRLKPNRTGGGGAPPNPIRSAHLNSVGPLILPDMLLLLHGAEEAEKNHQNCSRTSRASATAHSSTAEAHGRIAAVDDFVGRRALRRARVTSHPPSMSFATSAAVTCSRVYHYRGTGTPHRRVKSPAFSGAVREEAGARAPAS